jgi:plastocyanin
MAKQIINTGLAANDGTGDPIRTAMIKVNANFTELYDANANTSNNFSGSYDDLTDKPTIPTDIGDLTDVDSLIPTDIGDLTDTGGLLAGGSTTFAGLTEINLADLDVHDIAVQAKTTFTVTANGSSAYRFDINGATDNPAIYVRAGETIAFDLTGLGGAHPFQIQTTGASPFNTGLIHVAENGTKTTGASAQEKTAGTLYWKVPASISGTYEYQCTAHAGMNGNINVEVAEGGSSLQSRTTIAGTTASLANNVRGDLNITGFKSYALLAIQTDKAAWVRIYATAAARSADVSRLETSDPAPDAGVIAEVITTGAQTVLVSPGTIGYNFESTPTTTIPCSVTNKSGSTGTVVVTLTALQLEA